MADDTKPVRKFKRQFFWVNRAFITKGNEWPYSSHIICAHAYKAGVPSDVRVRLVLAPVKRKAKR